MTTAIRVAVVYPVRGHFIFTHIKQVLTGRLFPALLQPRINFTSSCVGAQFCLHLYLISLGTPPLPLLYISHFSHSNLPPTLNLHFPLLPTPYSIIFGILYSHTHSHTLSLSPHHAKPRPRPSLATATKRKACPLACPTPKAHSRAG